MSPVYRSGVKYLTKLTWPNLNQLHVRMHSIHFCCKVDLIGADGLKISSSTGASAGRNLAKLAKLTKLTSLN